MNRRYWGWALSSDPFVIESLARTGYDVVVCDVQHGSMGFAEAARAIQLLDVAGVAAMIRISRLEIDSVPRYLDFGASGVIVATVDDAPTIAHAIEVTRYQPEGIRSYGGARFGLAPEPVDVGEVRPAVWAMIETKGGAASIDAIAAASGVSGLLVGPADLSRAFGLPPTHRREDKDWNQAVADVIEIAQRRGIRSCMTASNGEDAAHWLEQGFTDVAISSDIGHLRVALKRQLSIARGEESPDLAFEV